MKNATLKTLLFSAAFCGSMMGTQAQVELSFQQDRAFRDMIGWPSHRGTPFSADFNNDGLMDAYINGTSCVNGWTGRGVLAKNLGERKFEGDYEGLFETYIDYVTRTEEKQKVDEDGQPMFDGDGNPIMETVPVLGDDGEPIKDPVERKRFVGMKSGLPISIRGFGSQPIDFNNDGLVDFILLNQGGNDTGTTQAYILVKNLGNWQFEVVEDKAGAFPVFTDNGGGARFNESTQYSSMVTGDYDKDGFTDVLICGNDPQGRYVRLLRNIGGDHFENVNVFNPLPFDVEVNRKGLYEETEGSIDEDTGDMLPGDYTQTPTKAAKPMSHGSVVMADLDGDGWLDIVCTGYCDGTDNKASVGVEPGGDEFRIYRNLRNGEFQDVTPELIPSAQVIIAALNNMNDAEHQIEIKNNIEDVFNAWGCEEGATIALDYDQNGIIDLMQLGTQGRNGNRALKQANVLLNMSDSEGFKFEEFATTIAPVAMSAWYRLLIADFNGDDVPDYWQVGWSSATNPDTGNRYEWSCPVSLSTGTTAWETAWYGDGTNEYWGGFLAKSDGENAFGDFDGDGKLDLISTGWTDKADDHIVSYATTEYEVVAPEAIGAVTATADKGTVKVEWDATTMNNGQQAMFNVYIKNNNTGEYRMVVPANIETGKTLCYPMFSTYVLAGNEDGNASYEFANLPNGDYTVGVQAINYSYVATGWTTTTVSVTEGEDAVKSAVKAAIKVSVNGNQITAVAAEDAPVVIVNAAGAVIAQGRTNEAITANGKGVFFVKAGKDTVKVIK